jgi:hypothetical protein
MMVDVKPAGASWYKRAIIYQAHVRTFFDSNGEGVGDFQGLDQKMAYLEELGINAVWLMLFFHSRYAMMAMILPTTSRYIPVTALWRISRSSSPRLINARSG